MVHVMMPLSVPDLAGALQDDRVALVDLLVTLSELVLISGGELAASVEMHLPADRMQARTLRRFLVKSVVVAIQPEMLSVWDREACAGRAVSA